MAISRREIVSFTLCACAARTQDGYDFFSIFLYCRGALLFVCMCGDVRLRWSEKKDLLPIAASSFVRWPVLLCADFKSYPKTIPTEIIYCRLSLTTQQKPRWYATALHNSLYTFLRFKQAICPSVCFRFSRLLLLPNLLPHKEKIQIDFLWIFVCRLSTQCRSRRGPIYTFLFFK